MATKSYKKTENPEMKAEEPAVAYPQAPYILTDSEKKLIMRSQEDIKAGRVYTQEEVDNIIFDESLGQDSFEERYRKAKEFAYKHFDPEYIQSLEARNFLVDEPFPLRNYTDEEWEKELERAEKEGDATDEEVANMYSIWENGE